MDRPLRQRGGELLPVSGSQGRTSAAHFCLFHYSPAPRGSARFESRARQTRVPRSASRRTSCPAAASPGGGRRARLRFVRVRAQRPRGGAGLAPGGPRPHPSGVVLWGARLLRSRHPQSLRLQVCVVGCTHLHGKRLGLQVCGARLLSSLRPPLRSRPSRRAQPALPLTRLALYLGTGAQQAFASTPACTSASAKHTVTTRHAPPTRRRAPAFMSIRSSLTSWTQSPSARARPERPPSGLQTLRIPTKRGGIAWVAECPTLSSSRAPGAVANGGLCQQLLSPAADPRCALDLGVRVNRACLLWCFVRLISGRLASGMSCT